jgi:hypothetical protein
LLLRQAGDTALQKWYEIMPRVRWLGIPNLKTRERVFGSRSERQSIVKSLLCLAKLGLIANVAGTQNDAKYDLLGSAGLYWVFYSTKLSMMSVMSRTFTCMTSNKMGPLRKVRQARTEFCILSCSFASNVMFLHRKWNHESSC